MAKEASLSELVFGHLENEGLEVVRRDGRYFVRYDAGSHQQAWREDELSEQEFERLASGREGERQVILGLQERLSTAGIDPGEANWCPEH